MPRINENTKHYPKGKLLGKNADSIPADYQFVIAPAADGYLGTYNDPGSYVFPNWQKQVDLATLSGVLMGAMLTLRISGNDYPIDYINPNTDQQLGGFLHALKNKTYTFIVLSVISIDSDVATTKAIRFFVNQLKQQTGKRVFVVVSEDQWKSSVEFDTFFGSETSDLPLLIVGDYETGIGRPIETPGLWKLENGLIWEEKPGEYRAWPPVDEWYFSQTPLPTKSLPEEEKPQEEQETGSGYKELVEELQKANSNMVVLSANAEKVIELVDILKQIFRV